MVKQIKGLICLGKGRKEEAPVISEVAKEGETESVKEATVAETETAKGVGETLLIVEAESFSYYTVEFTYDEKRYVLDGDSEVKLSVIQEEVGLTGIVTGAVSSNPELFTVVKDTEGDDWTVTALGAFTSEESLTLTIGGFEYVMKVTAEKTYSETIWWTYKNNILYLYSTMQTGCPSFSGDTQFSLDTIPWKYNLSFIKGIVVEDGVKPKFPFCPQEFYNYAKRVLSENRGLGSP